MKTKDSHANADPSQASGSRHAAVAANAYPPLKSCLSARLVPLAVLLLALTATVQAQFNYEIHDGTVTITKYTGPGGDVVIPETIEGKPVTSIGDSAFHRCTNLASVTIGNSVTSIGDHAFYGCGGLTSVTIGNSVTSIGGGAFAWCSSLASVTIGNSVTSIGNYAFGKCSGLTSITIPDSVTSIGDNAFYDCGGLTSVTIGNSVTSIGNRAFFYCTGLTSIEVDAQNPAYSSLDGVLLNKDQTALIQCPGGKAGAYSIPDSVTSIGTGAFLGCSGLTSIVIPDSVTNIGGAAFEGCASLTSITIPNSVTSIGDHAFYGCGGLTSVTIGNSVTSIGTGAFLGCSGLTSIVIPDSVTNIGGAAFEGCASLTSITIPDSVTSIEWGAFDGCTRLTRIDVDIRNGVYSSFDGALLNKIGTVFMLCPQGRTSVEIPDSVTSIEWGAFDGCSRLIAFHLGALNPRYSSLDGLLFNKDHTVLIRSPEGKASAKIPASVSRVTDGAFAGCWGLQAVYFYGDTPTMTFDVFGETMATLFYVSGTAGWETTMAGCPTVEWNGLFGAQSLEMYAGLTILGEIGKVYSIEYVMNLTEPTESDWRCLEYLQLPASPYLWADKTAPATGKRFYRAVAMEPPENMVFIPPGTFRMGSPEDEVDRSENEGPQTDVIISRGFWMGKYEVTQGEYEAVMGHNPSWFKGDTNRPVEHVSWDDAMAYCAALTERERLAGRIAPNSAYRLPTEAEWEYACRAGTSTRFSYGDDPGYTNLTNYAWYRDNSGGTTHPVGQKLPNPWGLHDMHGNVFERCQDWYADRLPGGIVLDPQGPVEGYLSYYRVFRGGGWARSSGFWVGWDGPRSCRSAIRSLYISDFVSYHGGFRAVLAPGQP